QRVGNVIRIRAHRLRGGAVWQLVGLITRRSQVRILPPLPRACRPKAPDEGLFCWLYMVQSLHELVVPVIAALGYELWHLEYVGPTSDRILRIYIDSPDGITLDDCQKVSNEVDAVLDVAQAQGERMADYSQLEVSSPGLDRPLVTAAHFARFIGEVARIKSFAPVSGQRNFCGVIQAVDGDTVELVVDDKTFSLASGDMGEARQEPTI